jgi:hypothetical protein
VRHKRFPPISAKPHVGKFAVGRDKNLQLKKPGPDLRSCPFHAQISDRQA